MRRRRKPSHGVWIEPGRPTIVLVTACTRGRRPWLASPDSHRALREAWGRSRAWLVGRYVLMPDHLHLFAAPGPLELTLERWIRHWKSWLARTREHDSHAWQAGHWDTRLRSGGSYEDAWWYARHNPVRAGLVVSADDWPFQGELNRLEW